MNRKAILILLALVLTLGIIFAFLFFNKTGPVELSENPTIPSGEPCSTFQSEDQNKPCFKPETAINRDTLGSNNDVATIPTGVALMATDVLSLCNSGPSIENNDCIKNYAKTENNPKLCDLISGSFGKTNCQIDVARDTRTAVDINLLPKNPSPIGQFVVSPIQTTPSLPSPTFLIFPQTEDLPEFAKNLIAQAEYDLANPDPRLTADGFYDRMATIVPLSLFSVAPLQSKPGDTVTAFGFGFSKTDNTVQIGNRAVSGVQSTDGMTLTFSIPTNLSYSTYDVWVTNDRGTSKNPGQPIRIIISSNPKPAPEITGVTPANPKVGDTVTLSGKNLGGIIEVATSLGSAGKSLSFKPASLEFYKFVIDTPELIGKLIPVYVYVVTDAGFNQEPFIFNVQF